KQAGTPRRSGDDIFLDREARPEAEALQRPGDAQSRQAVGRRTEKRFTTVIDAAGVGTDEAADGVEEGRLAGPIGPDDAVDLTGLDPQRHLVERDNATETHHQAGNLEGRGGWRRHVQPRSNTTAA